MLLLSLLLYSMQPLFDHERLEVYQAATAFVAWTVHVIDPLPRSIGAVEPIARASTTVPRNRAEGNGKSALRDRARFLEIAKGSALECAASLDVSAAQRHLSPDSADAGKLLLVPVGRLPAGLIANCPDRWAAAPAAYGIPPTGEQE